MITIDPNLRGCGVALWVGDTLKRAFYVKNPVVTGRGYKVGTALARNVVHHIELAVASRFMMIVEMPRVYPGMPQTDLNDLLDVMGVGAAVAALHSSQVEHVFPSDWKGNVKKQLMLERIWSKLSDAEKAVVQKTNKSDTEDILDAVGIGLFKLNRLTTRKFANE